jgi:hypothetical protein
MNTTIRTATVSLTKPIVTAFDNYGSHWSTLTGNAAILDAEKNIDWAAVEGQRIDEWQVTDRTGRPMRVVRIADPTFLDTILAFS